MESEVQSAEIKNFADEEIVLSAEDMMFVVQARGAEFNDKIQDTREKVEQFFGSKEFSYQHNGGVTYSGTAAQVLDSCPHAQTIAGQDGFEAFASWIAPHERTEEQESSGEEDANTDTAETRDVSNMQADKETKVVSEGLTETPTIVEKKIASVNETVSDKIVLTTIVPILEKSINTITTSSKPNTAEELSDSKLIVKDAETPSASLKVSGAEIVIPDVESSITENNVEKKPSADSDADLIVSTVVDSEPTVIIAEPAIVDSIATTIELVLSKEVETETEKASIKEEKTFAAPDQTDDAQETLETINEEQKDQAIQDARFHAMSFYEDDQVEVIENVLEPIVKIDLEEEKSDREPYSLEALLKEPEYNFYETLIATEEDEPIETYEDVYELVQQHQDIPAELVVASLFLIPLNSGSNVLSYEDSVFVKDDPRRPFTHSSLTKAALRIRIEAMYADISEDTSFEDIPVGLREQLIDFLYRLGYDNPSKAMQELVDRHGLKYILSFASRAGMNVEQAAPLHGTVTLARKKRYRIVVDQLIAPVKMAQFVVNLLHAKSVRLVYE